MARSEFPFPDPDEQLEMTRTRSSTTAPSIRSEDIDRAPSSAGRRSPMGSPPQTARVHTVPPWALSEPPSPPDSPGLSPILSPSSHLLGAVPTLNLSTAATETSAPTTAITTPTPTPHLQHDSSAPSPPPQDTSWWTFVTHPRRPPGLSTARPSRPLRPRSLTWFPRPRLAFSHTAPAQAALSPRRRPQDADGTLGVPLTPSTSLPSPPLAPVPSHQFQRAASMHLDLSMPPTLPPLTLRQVLTPGWESPWRPVRALGGAAADDRVDGEGYGWGDERENEREGPSTGGTLGTFRKRRRAGKHKKRWLNFILNHSAVPLILRILNITFTTTSLAVAIHTRLLEQAAGVKGAIGSSPAVVIVFAPLTMVHVMVAIYLEYFGRPLGLWRTSHKLTHTLLEVVFVCLWSSALSLCVDNYLTTPLRCVAPSLSTWWDALPPSPSPLPQGSMTGRWVCNDQLAQIFLVFVGLGLYCSNLVISLFRIFEKVKPRRSQNAV